MEQIPRLSEDVLYIISEKLLFKKLCGQIDLRTTNGYTLFMFHSLRNMRALLSHFSKMKHLDLSVSDNDCLIKFYKEEIPLTKRISKYPSSPYFVNKKIFSDLLEAGLLRISHIKITSILGQLSKVDFSAANKNIYKYLVNLEEGLSDLGSSVSPSLNISNIVINEPAETMRKHLITLLSMNIEDLYFIGSDYRCVFDSDPKTFELVLLERPLIPMERTKNIKTKCSIEIDSKSTTRLLKNLMNYIQFLLLCCPNLESIYFDLAFDLDLKTDFFSDSDSSESISGDSFYEISPEEYVTNLELFFSSIIDYLKNLKNGGKNLKIAVEFCSKFAANHYVLIPKNNKLFSMGKHMEIKSLVIDRENGNHQEEEVPAFIGRDIEVVDSIGRQHQCFVQIISEGPLDYLGYYINDDFFNGGHGFDANAYIDAYSLDPYDFYQC